MDRARIIACGDQAGGVFAYLFAFRQRELVRGIAALDAVRAADLDGEPRGRGPRDVLCQHILIRACRGPFDARDFHATVRSAGAYSDLTREEFDDCLELVATGGYAIRA